jgi:Flp pilus assembly CpaF family ATPase
VKATLAELTHKADQHGLSVAGSLVDEPLGAASPTSILAATSRSTSAQINELVASLVERVAQRFVEAAESRGEGLTTSDGAAEAEGSDSAAQTALIHRWCAEELARMNQQRLALGGELLSASVVSEVQSRVTADLLGSGPLEPWMADRSVEEIDVNSHLSTFVTFNDGNKIDVGQLWSTSADLTAFQKRLARRMTRTGEGRLDTSSPMLTFQADDGSRVVMVLGGENEHGISTHPRIAIRRFLVRQVGLKGLAERGLFPSSMVSVLGDLARCGFTILISGPPGAGKTTLLTELLGEVAPTERIITVEKNLLELRLEEDPRHPDAPALFTRHSNSEGVGAISTRQLVELTRRLNPDRVVVGELVEDEALDMLDVASMCARGSMATIHAHTSEIVLSRLAYYVAKSNTSLPEYAVWNLISQTVDFVIHIDLVRNTGDGGAPVRRVTSILEVGGRGEGGGVATTEIWGCDHDGRLEMRAPLSVTHRRRLELYGAAAGSVAPATSTRSRSR